MPHAPATARALRRALVATLAAIGWMILWETLVAPLRPGGTLVVDASALLDETPRRALADSLRELGLDVQPQAHLGAEILATRPFSSRRAA